MIGQIQLSYYKSRISEIIRIQDLEDLSRIEECMRSDIFHATLDWLTDKQFDEGALKAVNVLRIGAEMGYWDSLNSDREA